MQLRYLIQMNMETYQQFPTNYDIYSIYRTTSIQKLRKRKRSYIPNILKTILENYPDLERFVAEKSLNSEYLQEVLTKIVCKIIKLKKKFHLNSTKEFFQKSFVSSFSLCDSVKVEQIATTFQDSKLILRKPPSCKELETRTFCVANVWAGFPTFGSIYSTSKVVQQLKDNNNKEFIAVMLKILIKKYPRLKIIFLNLPLSDYYITETFLYIIKQAEKIEQSSCKQKKKEFFSTVFNFEILSNILNQCIHTDSNINKDMKNVSKVLDINKTSFEELSAGCTSHGSSSVCVDKKSRTNSIHQLDLATEHKLTATYITSENNGENRGDLHEYLKKLKMKYAWIQEELTEKSNLEKKLEKKLKYLLIKQGNYKYKIKKCRKEITEFDSFKSVCRS